MLRPASAGGCREQRSAGLTRTECGGSPTTLCTRRVGPFTSGRAAIRLCHDDKRRQPEFPFAGSAASHRQGRARTPSHSATWLAAPGMSTRQTASLARRASMGPPAPVFGNGTATGIDTGLSSGSAALDDDRHSHRKRIHCYFPACARRGRSEQNAGIEGVADLAHHALRHRTSPAVMKIVGIKWPRSFSRRWRSNPFTPSMCTPR